MQRANTALQAELDSIERYLDLIEELDDFRSKSPLGSLAKYKFGRAAASTHAAIHRAGRWDTIALDGAVLFLSGVFEEAVREFARRLVDEIVTRYGTYRKLAPEIRQENFRGLAEYFRRVEDQRFSHLSVENVVTELADAVTNSTPLRLFNEGFARHDHNLRPQEISAIFGRLGVKKLWATLGAEQSLQAHFGTTQQKVTTTAAENRLNAFIDGRNGIAHSARGRQTMGATVVRDYVAYHRALGTALVSALTTHVAKLP